MFACVRTLWYKERVRNGAREKKREPESKKKKKKRARACQRVRRSRVVTDTHSPRMELCASAVLTRRSPRVVKDVFHIARSATRKRHRSCSFDKDAVLTRVSHLSRCATRPQTLAGIRWTQEYWNKRATKKRLVLGQTRLNILMWTVGALARRREQHSALLPCPKL